MPRARWRRRSQTSPRFSAASAASSVEATEWISTIPKLSRQIWSNSSRRPSSSRAAGRGRKSLSKSVEPALSTPALSASSTSPTPPLNSSTYLPGETGSAMAISTGARLTNASPTRIPRAMDSSSNSPSAGPGTFIGSDDPEVIFERAPPLPGEGERRGQSLSSGRGDGERCVSLARHAQARVRGTVLYEDGRVDHLCHRVQVVDVGGMHHRGVSEPMLGLDGGADAIRHVTQSNEGDHRHQQFQLHEGMRCIDLGEEQASLLGHFDPGGFGNLHCILADPIARGVALLNDQLLQSVDRGAAHLECAILHEQPLERVGDRGHREYLFLHDADDVVVQRGAVHDVASGPFQMRRFIDDHRWIAGAGSDRALARVHRGADNRGSPSDDDQPNILVLHQCLGRLDGGLSEPDD